MEQTAPPITYKIPGVTAGFLIGTALLLDAAQVVLAITLVASLLALLITFVAIPLFGIWFLILGENYFSGRRVQSKVASVFISTIVELIPILDAMPTITIGVVMVIRASRANDRDDYAANAQKASEAAQNERSIPSRRHGPRTASTSSGDRRSVPAARRRAA